MNHDRSALPTVISAMCFSCAVKTQSRQPVALEMGPPGAADQADRALATLPMSPGAPETRAPAEGANAAKSSRDYSA